MASSPRITPGDRKELGIIGWTVGQVVRRATKATSANLFTTMGRNRKLFRAWLHFGGRLLRGGALPHRDTELVILRVAHLRQCAYEFDHHVDLSKRAGITETDIERVRVGSQADAWTDRENAMLRAVEQLHKGNDVDDASWADLRRYLSEPEAIELVLLAGHYEMLATFIGTLRIQPDGHRPGR